MSRAESDFDISDHGSIVLLVPRTEAANDWADEHLPDDAPMFGAAYAIEPRFLLDICDGIRADGLKVGSTEEHML